MHQANPPSSDYLLTVPGPYNNPGQPAYHGLPQNHAKSEVLRSTTAKIYLYWLYLFLVASIFLFVFTYANVYTYSSSVDVFWRSIFNEATLLLFAVFQILSIEERNLKYATYALVLALIGIAATTHSALQGAYPDRAAVLLWFFIAFHLFFNIIGAFIVRRKLRDQSV